MKKKPINKIETPALLLDMNALENNIKIMSDYFKDKQVKLRPHFKTDKCPVISQMQLKAGAKGITCAKLGEAEVLISAGIKDILIANQIISHEKLNRIAELSKSGINIKIVVDNAENILDISKAATAYDTNIHVFVELNVGMNRCGVDSAQEVLDLARLILKSKGVIFDGIQAYEGHLSLIPSESERLAGVDQMIKKVITVIDLLNNNGITVNEISGGGTGTYYMTGNNTVWTEIQAGSYLFMDSKYDIPGLSFKQALTVLTTVIHKRDGFAVTDAGKKSCCTDNGVPIIKGYRDISVLKLSEEHGTLEDRQNVLKLGQKMEYIPGHCCTTVNLHDFYHCVRDGYLEDIWEISGRGKSR